jgi:hypothetical protein
MSSFFCLYHVAQASLELSNLLLSPRVLEKQPSTTIPGKLNSFFKDIRRFWCYKLLLQQRTEGLKKERHKQKGNPSVYYKLYREARHPTAVSCSSKNRDYAPMWQDCWVYSISFWHLWKEHINSGTSELMLAELPGTISAEQWTNQKFQLM